MVTDVKDFGVFRFDYVNTDYEELIQELAQKMRAKVCDSQLTVPPDLGSGTISFIKLPNGLHAALFDFSLQQDWLLHREKQDDEFFILRFDEITVPGALVETIDDQKIREKNASRSMAYLISSKSDWSYQGTAGAHFRGITMVFSKKWLAGYLDIGATEEVLSEYIAMKAGNINIEPLDAQYRQYLKTICVT